METRCSDDEMLADYFEGRLSDQDRTEMEAHLSECKMCMEALVVANSVVRGRSRFESEAAPNEVTEAAVCLINRQTSVLHGSLMQRLKRSIKGLPRYSLLRSLWSKVSDFLRLPWVEWRLARIRGSGRIISEDLINVRKSFNGLETEIEIEKTGHNKAHIRVKAPEYDSHKKTLRITLKRGEREISSYLLNGAYVLFEDIPFGHYSLAFVRDGAKIGTYLFEIKETHHDGR